VIRLAREDDGASLAEIYDPIVRDTPISFETQPPDAAGMAGRVRQTLAQYPWLVYERDGVVVGYAYGSQHHVRDAYQWAVNVTVYIDERSRRAGVGRALYTSLFRILVAQGYYRACAGITLPNPGSVGLHEAMGFVPVGVYRDVGFKLGRWHDVGWWQRSLQGRPGIPAPPRSVAAVQQSAQWPALLGA
jgi:phosphinothricin acetyltransferase